MSSPTTQFPGPRRLSRAHSPYLRQHADNPVDWYEWGPDALAAARQADKPIFLSIGYAACHWCHVMGRESFANPEIATLLNQNFINIKVDREERPDLDEIYMQATLVLNDGQGGWPMSVWLTPDLKPFFAGTYFPPTTRYGRPGFKDLIQRIAEAWQQHRDEIAAHAEKLTAAVRGGLTPEPAGEANLTLATVDRAAEALVRAFDPQSGGMSGGGTNKFPPSMALELMLRSAHRRPADDPERQHLLDMVQLTLDRMADGGIYDQLGGGFHRYSTDLEWHVPHFEKMLYDQALLSRIYLDAYQLYQNPLYARIAREVLDYVLADLQSSGGGFYSTRDADSDGKEGQYYVWTRAEVLETLGPDDGPRLACYYDITEMGNWNDPHEPGVVKSIPRILRGVKLMCRLHQLEPAALEATLARGRARLLAARARRPAPALDDKILCEWNGLMIGSLARGAAVLDEPRYAAAAARAAGFILENQHSSGRLSRTFDDGGPVATAFLSDYASLVDGLLELYEATFEPRWLHHAVALNRATIEHFWDHAAGGFYFTANDHEPLIARSKDVADNVMPSGNSAALLNLLRLAALLGDDELRTLADRQIAAFAGSVLRAPWASERFLTAVEFARAGPTQIVFVGNPADPRMPALIRQAHSRYLPNRVLMLCNPGAPADAFQSTPSAATSATPNAAPGIHSPLFDGRTSIDGQPTAYVCRNGACRPPATTPQQLAQLLSETA